MTFEDGEELIASTSENALFPDLSGSLLDFIVQCMSETVVAGAKTEITRFWVPTRVVDSSLLEFGFLSHTAESVDRFSDHGLDLCFDGDVGFDEGNFDIPRGGLSNHGFRYFHFLNVTAVVDSNIGTLLSEPDSYSLTDSRAGPCDWNVLSY